MNVGGQVECEPCRQWSEILTFDRQSLSLSSLRAPMAYSPFALCVVVIVTCLLLAIGIVSVYETGRYGYVPRSGVWKSWNPRIHWGWLLAVRIVGFLYCTAILIYDVALSGPFVFEYYTQWSFTLLILYFWVAIVTSFKEISYDRKGSAAKSILSNSLLGFRPQADEEFATSVDESQPIADGRFDPSEEAGPDGYTAQILYQIVLGAAIVTDTVFWAFIFPSYSFVDVIEISMHAVNLVLLLADVALNNMVFYWFRGAYFFIYSVIFIFFAWIVHALGEKQWPYSFLDVSVSLAPLWYLAMCIIHVIAYALISGVMYFKETHLVRYQYLQ